MTDKRLLDWMLRHAAEVAYDGGVIRSTMGYNCSTWPVIGLSRTNERMHERKDIVRAMRQEEKALKAYRKDNR